MEKWFDQVWNNASEATIDEMMHRDVVFHGLDPAGTATGMNNFKVFYKNFRESFPVVHVDLTPLVSNEEYATVYCNVTATSSSGKEVAFSGLCVGRYDASGKLVEAWNNFDFLKMYQQLGHILMAKIEE
jgi:predicted ester cyclase